MLHTRCISSTLPKPDYNKYTELVHYIVAKAGNLPNFGKVLLYKMLYFSDFDFYELFEKSITNESYRKIEMGPAPCHIDKVLTKLVETGKIIPVDSKYFKYDQKKYIAKEEPELRNLDADEIETANKVINRLSSMSATQVSYYSHQDTPWKVTEDKDVISYGLVFYRTSATSVKE